MFKGLEVLKNLRYSSGELSDLYSYHSTKIRNSSLKNGIKYYNTAITKFLGNSIIKRLENVEKGDSVDKIREYLKPTMQIGRGPWVDISGMIAPKSEIDSLLNSIENKKLTSIDEINSTFAFLHSNYYNFEWQWAYEKLEEFFGISLSTINKEEIISIIKKWQEAVIGLDRELYEDAKKEFNLASMTGFGADGDKAEKERDFEQVRGDFDTNSFVNAVLEHIRVKQKLGDDLIDKLS